MDKSLRPYVAELIGTFGLVFVSAGAVCSANLASGIVLDVTGIAVVYGLALAVMLGATINVSGGYLNPAITITLWVLRRFDNVRAAWLLGAQLLGAALAGAVLRILFAPGVMARATPHLSEALVAPTREALLTGAGVEVLLTFLLTFVVFATIIDPRAPKLSGLGAGLTVGLGLVALVLVGYPITGAALNPARAFGPLVWESTFEKVNLQEHLFVYWIGPVVGALLAGLLYTYLILPPAERAAAVEVAHAKK